MELEEELEEQITPRERFERAWNKLEYNLGEYVVCLDKNIPGKFILSGFWNFGLLGQYPGWGHYELIPDDQWRIPIRIPIIGESYARIHKGDLISDKTVQNDETFVYLFETGGLKRRWEGYPVSLGIKVGPIKEREYQDKVNIECKIEPRLYHNASEIKKRELEGKVLQMVRDVIKNLKINLSSSHVEVPGTKLEHNTGANTLYSSLEDRLSGAVYF